MGVSGWGIDQPRTARLGLYDVFRIGLAMEKIVSTARKLRCNSMIVSFSAAKKFQGYISSSQRRFSPGIE